MSQNKKLQDTQNQVDEVMGIMRTNVDKVLERDQKLTDLDDRAENLQVGANQFERTATRLKRRMWWKNFKMWIIIGVVAVVLITIIAVLIWKFS
ncbi:vesicle-associated membrane protein 3-like [Sycon ciliatum]|uniref:vesicle-associated membrane protein 3-like n=1 Tax=Sycon ciliatum TaxID=27933 RepID=UPI0020A9A81C